MSTLATELNVPPNSRHAFDELIAKTSQRLNRTLTSTDLAEWKDSLLSAAAEVDINAFIELPSTSAKIAAVDATVRQRTALTESLIFTCVYGKQGNRAISFEEALSRVLREFADRRAPGSVEYRRGKFDERHLAIRTAAFPYKPACGTAKGAPVIEAIDSSTTPPTLLGYLSVDKKGYIDDLSVLPRCQGFGVAQGIVTKTAELLKAEGASTLSLHVRALNKPALRLYAKLGLTAGENEFPPWYDWHGGFHLEGPISTIAKHHMPWSQYHASKNKEKASVSSSSSQLPDFVSLFKSVSAARGGSRSQTGASNCGATAVMTQIAALGVKEDPSGELIVRSRDYSTRSLFTFLQSRSKAGCTGEDLVTGAKSLSGNTCTAVFYPTGPEPPRGLAKWLAEMVHLGAAPIATINTQLDGADFWHHQAVLGVYPNRKKLMMANPCEEVDEAELARLLGSKSEMLIYKEDVLQRCPPSAEDLKGMRDAKRWAALKVADQVEEVMAGKKARGAHDRVIIPASYTPGITLIAKNGSEAAQRIAEGAQMVEGGLVGQGPWRK